MVDITKAIRNFFDKGEFVTSLQESMSKLELIAQEHSKELLTLAHQNELLVEQIKSLTKENQDLRKIINNLDSRLWDLKVVNDSDTLIIAQSSRTSKPRLLPEDSDGE